jgi:glycine betaine transporter
MQGLTSRVGAVFYVSVALAVAFVLWGVLFTANMATVFQTALDYVISNFGAAYLLAVTGFLIFILYLGLSRYGRIKLGRDDEIPEFSTLAWLSMLFAAGIGLSFLFWGVAEPASHFGTPPHGMAEAGTPEAAQLSLQYTFFHWGLHPWAVYAVVAMALAYFGFRRGEGNLISSVFRSAIGDRVDGAAGKAIDILAIFAVLFGVATALGLGATQLNGGLSYVFDLPSSVTVQMVIIAVLTAAFLVSAITGISRGILYLSLLNMALAVGLLVFVFFAGPTVFLLDTFTQSLGQYFGQLAPMSLRTDAFSDSSDTWAATWTIFYWAWWVSWAPFVGAFIARISRGRTIRQFVFGVILAPSLFSFIWFTVLGGTAIFQDLFRGDNVAETAAGDLPRALFDTLNAVPLGPVISVVALVLVSVFFITSGDSASFVLSSMSTGGSEDPPTGVKVVWGLIVAFFAAVLLVADGLDALRTATTVAAVPFTLVMIWMCFALFKGLSQEFRQGRKAPEPSPQDSRAEESAENGQIAPQERQTR